jgi:thymidine phosphorylase
VKVGNGAFLPARAQAEELARTMIAIGRAGGRSTVAWLTAMDRPLGHAVGNAIEVMECIATLRGEGPADLVDVTLALAAEMLVLGDRATDLDAGRVQATAALEDGRALETLRTIIEAQDGDPTVLDEPERLPQAPVVRVVESAVAGTVSGIDARAIGHAAVALGAGRRRMDDRIDPRVGFHIAVKPADRVAGGDAIATVYAADEAGAEVAAASIEAAIRIDEGPADPLPLLIARIDGA